MKELLDQFLLDLVRAGLIVRIRPQSRKREEQDPVAVVAGELLQDTGLSGTVPPVSAMLQTLSVFSAALR
ncbi:hypothetical protein A5779_09660 [Mycolicibacterium peregrinum]|uniref:Uncharacterized protein n=1 Tax=Mycolicibacterium peregrinum TaxID=43304 RepID=A0A1A0VF31_MYCPR|nr:hypothetical protein A5779_09660 [Mycolicibacterium peregrinum]